jgi:hypothetical protein
MLYSESTSVRFSRQKYKIVILDIFAFPTFIARFLLVLFVPTRRGEDNKYSSSSLCSSPQLPTIFFLSDPNININLYNCSCDYLYSFCVVCPLLFV